jgi:hypothetical protein
MRDPAFDPTKTPRPVSKKRDWTRHPCRAVGKSGADHSRTGLPVKKKL